jgi:hypothetical protein
MNRGAWRLIFTQKKAKDGSPSFAKKDLGLHQHLGD